ncbi:MAG: hypothetical protein MZV63_15340 [Marinilabiliales bacterium]|nr:hypothetical protein [Marinilabiliales bacterium]
MWNLFMLGFGVHRCRPLLLKVIYAEVRVMTTVYNKSDKQETKVKIQNIIINQKGIEIARKEVFTELQAGMSRDIETTLGLTDPRRWDINNPVMYKVHDQYIFW